MELRFRSCGDIHIDINKSGDTLYQCHTIAKPHRIYIFRDVKAKEITGIGHPELKFRTLETLVGHPTVELRLIAIVII